MTDKKKTRLAAVGEMIRVWEEEEDRELSSDMLDNIMWQMAILLKSFCVQQGNSCEGCPFVLHDPERKDCECKINVGKNELGTAPRFWELVKRDYEDKERIDNDGQLGTMLPVREESE